MSLNARGDGIDLEFISPCDYVAAPPYSCGV